MKERELLIRSVVNLMLAVLDRVYRVYSFGVVQRAVLWSVLRGVAKGAVVAELQLLENHTKSFR
jgi:hypothetical protein